MIQMSEPKTNEEGYAFFRKALKDARATQAGTKDPFIKTIADQIAGHASLAITRLDHGAGINSVVDIFVYGLEDVQSQVYDHMNGL